MSRKKIGIALSGGAARGFAHLGVLKVLIEHGIPIDFIAGTSAGSFAGAAFASGLSVEEIIEMSQENQLVSDDRIFLFAERIAVERRARRICQNTFSRP